MTKKQQGNKSAMTVTILDEKGFFIGNTYPKRAQGLIKNKRAHFVDEKTICLVCPSHKMEDIDMKYSYNDNEVQNEVDELLNSAAETETMQISENILLDENANLNDVEKFLKDDAKENLHSGENIENSKNVNEIHIPSIDADVYLTQFEKMFSDLESISVYNLKCTMFFNITSLIYGFLDNCVNSKMVPSHKDYAVDLKHEGEIVNKVMEMARKAVFNINKSYKPFIANPADSDMQVAIAKSAWDTQYLTQYNANEYLIGIENRYANYVVNVKRVVETGTWRIESTNKNSNDPTYYGNIFSDDEVENLDNYYSGYSDYLRSNIMNSIKSSVRGSKDDEYVSLGDLLKVLDNASEFLDDERKFNIISQIAGINKVKKSQYYTICELINSLSGLNVDDEIRSQTLFKAICNIFDIK